MTKLIGTIKRANFRKVRKESILKIYNNLVLPTFLYGSENWTLTALQRRRIEAAEMKILRLLVGYTLHDHKTKDSLRHELQTECILEKIDEYTRNWLLYLQRMPQNQIPLKSYHSQTTRKENNWKTESSCNSGEGPNLRVQSLTFMMMITSVK
jgi:hypothetical protein